MRPEKVSNEDDLPDGWTSWKGETGECPCPGQPVDVMFEDGHVSMACVQMPRADGWYWRHSKNPAASIIAYRISSNPDLQ